jgi:hypothetical protein
LPLNKTRSLYYNGTPVHLVTDITYSYLNATLGLVCQALQLLARLLRAEVGFANEDTKALDG